MFGIVPWCGQKNTPFEEVLRCRSPSAHKNLPDAHHPTEREVVGQAMPLAPSRRLSARLVIACTSHSRSRLPVPFSTCLLRPVTRWDSRRSRVARAGPARHSWIGPGAACASLCGAEQSSPWHRTLPRCGTTALLQLQLGRDQSGGEHKSFPRPRLPSVPLLLSPPGVNLLLRRAQFFPSLAVCPGGGFCVVGAEATPRVCGVSD